MHYEIVRNGTVKALKNLPDSDKEEQALMRLKKELIDLKAHKYNFRFVGTVNHSEKDLMGLAFKIIPRDDL